MATVQLLCTCVLKIGTFLFRPLQTKISNDQIHGIMEYLEMKSVPTNSAPGQFGHIGQIERVGIIAK